MTIKEFEIQLALGTLTYEMKCKVAKNSNTPKEVLTILSTDEYWGVRWDIACSHNTPVEVLTKLATDGDWGVRWCIADNINTPKEILTILSTDEDKHVKANAIKTLKILK